MSGMGHIFGSRDFDTRCDIRVAEKFLDVC